MISQDKGLSFVTARASGSWHTTTHVKIRATSHERPSAWSRSCVNQSIHLCSGKSLGKSRACDRCIKVIIDRGNLISAYGKYRNVYLNRSANLEIHIIFFGWYIQFFLEQHWKTQEPEQILLDVSDFILLHAAFTQQNFLGIRDALKHINVFNEDKTSTALDSCK